MDASELQRSRWEGCSLWREAWALGKSWLAFLVWSVQRQKGEGGTGAGTCQGSSGPAGRAQGSFCQGLIEGGAEQQRPGCHWGMRMVPKPTAWGPVILLSLQGLQPWGPLGRLGPRNIIPSWAPALPAATPSDDLFFKFPNGI